MRLSILVTLGLGLMLAACSSSRPGSEGDAGPDSSADANLGMDAGTDAGQDAGPEVPLRLVSTQSFVVAPTMVPVPIDLVELAHGRNATVDARDVSWTSSDPTIASVVLSALGATTVVGHIAGEVTLSGTYAGVVVAVPVRITSAQLVSVGVDLRSSIPKGTSRRIAVIATYDDGSRYDVTRIATLSTAESAIATIVNNKGIDTTRATITAVAPGETEVTATLPSMVGAPVAVEVTDATLDWIGVEGSGRLLLDAPARFQAVGHFSDNSSADLTDSVVWTVRAPLDALGEPIPDLTLGTAILGDEPGVVIPTAVGVIEVYAELDGADGNQQPTIVAESPVSIRIDNDLGGFIATLPIGVTEALRAWFVYEDGSEDLASSYVVWATDSGLATIGNGRFDAGLFRARDVGMVAASASYGELVGSVDLAITGAQLVSLEMPTGPWGGALFTPNAFSGFYVLGTFDDASVHDMTRESSFESSDASCVAVEPLGGRWRTGETGHCAVTASFGGVSTVLDLILRPITSVTLVEPAAITVGQSVTIAATGVDSLAQEVSLNPYMIWASPNSNIATVSNAPGERGLVTAVGPGTVFVTATFDGNAWPVQIVVDPLP